MNFIIRDISKTTSTSSSSTSYSGGSSSSSYTPLNYLSLVTQSSNLAGANGVIKLTDTNYLLTDSGWKFSTLNTDGTFNDLMTLDINGNLLVKGEVCAYAVGSFTGDTGSTGGLIKSVYGYSNLGGSFDNADLTSTFNAYTVNQLNSRLVTIENKNYLTDLTSELLISTLGYTPYSANNPSGYVTLSSIPTKLSQLNNDSGYITSASLSSYVLKAGDTMTGNLTTKGLSITNGTQTVNLIVDANGYLSVDNDLYSSGDISAFGAGTGSTGGGSGLIQTVYSYSNLGDTFNNTTLTDTFNAYTINQMNNRLVSVENGSLTSISSDLVISALGYTPYNASNPSGFITNSSLQTKTSQLTNDSGFITGINSSQVTTALGYTPYNSTNPSGYITSSSLPTNNNQLTNGAGYITSSALSPYQLISTVSSLKVDGATKLWSQSHPNDYYLKNNWDGTYWQLTSNHSAPVNVGHSDNAGYASSAGYLSLQNCGTPDQTGLNGIYYCNGGTTPAPSGSADGTLIASSYVNDAYSWGSQIYQDYRAGYLYIRGRNSGSWSSWLRVIDSNTIGSQSVNYATYSNHLAGADAHTNGSDGWWRSNGSCGWYNESYAVGIYAVDSTYVRTYNNASFVANNIIANGEVTAYSTSDKRLKKNIKPINNSLSIINKLNPVSYNWNEKAKELNPNKDNKKDVGVIAQELEKVLPNLVHNIYSDEQYKGVDYIKLIPYLIGAIQELTTEINKLKNK